MKNILLCLGFLATIASYAQPKVGVQLYSFRNEFKQDVKGTLEKIKGMGIQIAEGGDTYGLPQDEFMQLLKQNNIKVVSVGAGFDDLDKDVQKVISKAKSYGAEFVVCTWIPHQGDDFNLGDIQKAVAVFSKAGKEITKAGLSLCYHPHGYEFRPYQDGNLFDYLVKNTNEKEVNFEMDVFWVKHPGQDPVALLKKYPNRFKLLHLKDRKHGTVGNQNGRADVETNVVLGSGDVGIAEIMKAAKELKIKYAFIEDESSRSMTQVPESLTFLKDIK